MSQFLRPSSDITTTNVSAGTFASIDESVASDADFVIGTNNTTTTYECAVSDPSGTPASGTCTIRFRHAQGDHDTSPFAPADAGQGFTSVTCALVEGTTVLATDDAQTNSAAFVLREFTFATSLVTDWTDLRLRFTITGAGGSGANRRTGAVSFAEIETPDAGATTHSGSGTPSLPLLTASGAGKKTRKGTGTPSLPLQTATGSGSVANSVATCTQAIVTPDDATTPNTTGAFVPAAGDLLVVIVVGGNSLTPAAGELTSSEGLTFHLSATVNYPPSPNHLLAVYVANEFATAVSQTVTFTPLDDATSTVIGVLRVAGMSRVGSSAVRQVKTNTQNVGTDATPGATFDAAALTANAVIAAAANLASPAGLTEPSGFTEAADSGALTPTIGLEYAFVNSGFTGTAVDWGTSGTSWGAVLVELDTSSASTEHPGSGTPSLPLSTASGVGKRGLKSTGTPSLPLITASGTGTKTRKGTGTPSLPLLTASGTGTKVRKGTGTPSLPLLAADGSGEVSQVITHPGTGTPSLPVITASGSGKRGLKSTGTPSLPLITASGEGKKTRKGTGTPELPLLTADGTGTKTRKGTGTPSLPLLTASGEGKKTRKGTGTPSLPLTTASGSGTVTEPGVNAGSGTPSLPLITAEGAGKRGLRSTGTPALPALTASGTAKRALKGTGAPSLPLLTAAGTGSIDALVINEGQGDANLPVLTASGTGKRTLRGSGAVVLPFMAVTGTGNRVWIGSGDITLPMLTASGVGGDDEFFTAASSRVIAVSRASRTITGSRNRTITVGGGGTINVESDRE